MGKLQEQMKTDLVLKGYSHHTTRAYLYCIRNFAKDFMRSPAEMGATEIRKFMLHLAQDRKVSAFSQSQHVYTYLSRYTHRVAISNHRFISCNNGHVTFKARNNQSPENPRLVTLLAEEFVRRFLLHVEASLKSVTTAFSLPPMPKPNWKKHGPSSYR